MSPSTPAPRGPGLLDALSLLSEVADELVVSGVRDTHYAWADRGHALARRVAPGASDASEQVHRSVASAVYGGLGLGLRLASAGLERAGENGGGPRLDAGRAGRRLSATVNGLLGDRLVDSRSPLAIAMSVRADGHDVPLTRDGLADAYPEATERVVVLLHGLFDDEGAWDRDREALGPTYAEDLAERGWTPVQLRMNTGLSLRANGAALSSLLQELVEQWPVAVSRIALVGHSMGGLVLRTGSAVALEAAAPWTDLVSDVVTLGTPHLGAPVAWVVGQGSRNLARFPETAALGRILDTRSIGVHDLVEGLAEDVAALPHATYHLVAATLTASRDHLVGRLVGDLMVSVDSAHGRDRRGRDLFPGGDTLHVGGTDHLGLLNHPDVHHALADWLR